MFNNGSLYYIPIILQAICVIHCLRSGNQGRWIWIIIFLPVVGSIIYIFTEMFSGREMDDVKSGMGAIFNSAGRVKKLEENLHFADTFANKVALADAYLATHETEKAIQLYESSLSGAFVENEHVHIQLISAYFETQRYEDVIRITKKIYRLPQFARSRSHILYALSLEQVGKTELAEKELKSMKARFAYFEPRYQYGQFLLRAKRLDDAYQLYADMVDEAPHLSAREKRYNREWISKAKAELKTLENSYQKTV